MFKNRIEFVCSVYSFVVVVDVVVVVVQHRMSMHTPSVHFDSHFKCSHSLRALISKNREGGGS